VTTRHTIVGTVRRVEGVACASLDNTRHLLVYLPPGYDTSARRYPVVYMHDGQNLFDRATSFGDEWEVDETMEALAQIGVEAIVVGIPNMGTDRCNEYSPFPDPRGGGGAGEAYLDCLIATMKPRIDADFRTRPEREFTGILGSSMGGLISMFAFFRRPDSFGFAGAMSPALWFGQRALFPLVEAAPQVRGRLYLDVGTGEGAATLRDTRRLERLLRLKGYRRGESLLYVEDPDGEHSERAWARRLKTALYFLLPEPTEG
jgi:predicted alpha/beta superfamily hydrolase